jgi:hypothetical protein
MNTNKTSISSHRLAAMMLAILLAFTVAANAQSTHSANGLAGTWRVQVTVKDCSSGAPLLSFQTLLSFHEGGTMSGTTSNPTFAPGQRTSDYGVWSYQGNQTYSAASEAFLLFDTPRFVKGTQRIAQIITVDGDTFSSLANVEFFDSGHNPHGPALCAAATGTRFE